MALRLNNPWRPCSLFRPFCPWQTFNPDSILRFALARFNQSELASADSQSVNYRPEGFAIQAHRVFGKHIEYLPYRRASINRVRTSIAYVKIDAVIGYAICLDDLVQVQEYKFSLAGLNKNER